MRNQSEVNDILNLADEITIKAKSLGELIRRAESLGFTTERIDNLIHSSGIAIIKKQFVSME